MSKLNYKILKNEWEMFIKGSEKHKIHYEVLSTLKIVAIVMSTLVLGQDEDDKGG